MLSTGFCTNPAWLQGWPLRHGGREPDCSGRWSARLIVRSLRRSCQRGQWRDRDGGAAAGAAPFRRLSDAVGIFEHAKLDCPRPECGYCTGPTPGDCSPSVPAGLGSNRRPRRGRPRPSRAGSCSQGRLPLATRCGQHVDDVRPSDNVTGRALLGLGTAVARAPWPDLRDRALVLFGEPATSVRTPSRRCLCCPRRRQAAARRTQPCQSAPLGQ